MWNPARDSSGRLALTLAAAASAVAFLASAVMLKAGRALADGRPGVLLVAIVTLLAVTGALVLALAAKELLVSRRLHPASGAPRRRR
jgi:hypothetical protein